jgi:hypothetical protein
MVDVLAKVLTRTSPRSPHGRLLAAALQPRERRLEHPDHAAVLRLIGRGELPTPGAVVGEVANLERCRQAAAKMAARVATAVRADGPRAARLVAERWASTGTGPTWGELTAAAGWQLRPARRSQERAAIIRGLARAGWLIEGRKPRSLRPGPRYQGEATR